MIADRLVVSARTVETHVAHILQKLRADDRHEAARLYLSNCENQ
jgi:DNA-binding NarL/FixJ family response regulator